MMLEQTLSSTRLEQLRNRINDKDYLYAAIQRIALVLSNELTEISQERRYNERRRKRRR
jgi:hypothetical protein